MIEFRVFPSAESPIALFRFRYDVYVEEMHRLQKYADHSARIIVDPLDETGINVIAFDGAKIVGCVRTNFLRDAAVGEYEELFGFSSLAPKDRRQTSICTRLMIGASKRRTFVTIGVMRAIYEYGLPKGIRYNYIDCNEHLVSFFEKFGYQRISRRDHIEYGEVTIMRLDVLDLAHLESVGSPFASTLRALLERSPNASEIRSLSAAE